MKKRILPLIAACILLISLLPVSAGAITPLQPEKRCSMTLHYTQEGVGFSNLDISIYRIAGAQTDGSFYLIAPYAGYGIKIHGITTQREWDTVATTVKAFVVADKVPPTRTGRTNSQGTVTFTNLETGLYVVMGVTGENDKGTYEFNTFLVYVPTPNADGTFDYDVEARPKCILHVPNTEYKVVKLWKDVGYTSTRPKQVTVDIYKDGKLEYTEILSAANNWTFTWRVNPDRDGKWTVVEREVPAGYTVTVGESNGVFTVTNTREVHGKEEPPKTGDVFPLWTYVTVMTLSGILLILLGIYRKRKK